MDPRPLGLDRPPKLEPPRPSGVALWRPRIVLARHAQSTNGSPSIVLADPRLRPEAIQARLEATQSVLASVVEAEHALRLSAAAARSLAANSDRERVVAVMEAYRVTAALEAVLGRAVRRARALLENRGAR
jgi:hypothetical protein